MKTMIKMRYLILGLVASFTLASCDNEDYLVFTAVEPVEKVSFINEPNSIYNIFNLPDNVLERLIWTTPDFEAPTTITYEVEGSIHADFSTIDYTSGETSENQVAISIGDVFTIAEDNGLELFSMYFRVTAFVGESDGNNPIHSVSDPIELNIELVEFNDCEDPIMSNWGLVGSAVNDWGNNNQGYSTTNDVEMLQIGSNVFGGIVTFVDGEFKFRQDGAWGVNYGDTGADGTLDPGGDNLAATAGTYVVTLDLGNNSYAVTPADVVWGLVGSATFNGWGNGPDMKLFPDPCTDGVFVAKGVALTDGEIKFRKDDAWGENLGDTGADGVLDPGGDNIAVSAGSYDVMLDTVNNTYSITAN